MPNEDGSWRTILCDKEVLAPVMWKMLSSLMQYYLGAEERKQNRRASSERMARGAGVVRAAQPTLVDLQRRRADGEDDEEVARLRPLDLA